MLEIVIPLLIFFPDLDWKPRMLHDCKNGEAGFQKYCRYNPSYKFVHLEYPMVGDHKANSRHLLSKSLHDVR